MIGYDDMMGMTAMNDSILIFKYQSESNTHHVMPCQSAGILILAYIIHLVIVQRTKNGKRQALLESCTCSSVTVPQYGAKVTLQRTSSSQMLHGAGILTKMCQHLPPNLDMFG